MNPERQELLQIIEKASKSKKGLAIFDLDSTLFDVTPRTFQIIKDFAKNFENKDTYPEDFRKISDLEGLPVIFHIKDTLDAIGIESVQLKTELILFWKQHFFSNDYLDYDTLTSGAYEFISSLLNHNIEVMYLTGRDEIRMKEGTEARLKKERFLLNPLEKLVMKPNKEINDSEFKRDIVTSTDPDYDTIWFFENEPENIHLVKADAPHVQMVFFDSVHSGRKPEPGINTPRIKSFCH